MIFCVEDDESIQSLELYALRSAGFEVRGFVDGDAFLEALRTETPELVAKSDVSKYADQLSGFFPGTV